MFTDWAASAGGFGDRLWSTFSEFAEAAYERASTAALFAIFFVLIPVAFIIFLVSIGRLAIFLVLMMIFFGIC